MPDWSSRPPSTTSEVRVTLSAPARKIDDGIRHVVRGAAVAPAGGEPDGPPLCSRCATTEPTRTVPPVIKTACKGFDSTASELPRQGILLIEEG